jgi:hypothetical protein
MVTEAVLAELERRYRDLQQHLLAELAVQRVQIAELSAEIAELEDRLAALDEPPEDEGRWQVQ